MPRIAFHRLIGRDLRLAMNYYEAESGPPLAERFLAEAEAAIRSIETNPGGHHFSDSCLRRAALHSFPYHILYEYTEDRVWIAVLRHDRRHPNFGLHRRK